MKKVYLHSRSKLKSSLYSNSHSARYIDFYLDLVATSENVSLLYHVALQCKTVQDVENEPYSEVKTSTGVFSVTDLFPQRLYLLSEIADYAIKQRAQHQGWLIPPYPEKMKPPKDIMRPLSPEVQKRVRSKVYLTEDMVAVLGEVGKPLKPAQTKVRSASGTTRQANVTP